MHAQEGWILSVNDDGRTWWQRSREGYRGMVHAATPRKLNDDGIAVVTVRVVGPDDDLIVGNTDMLTTEVDAMVRIAKFIGKIDPTYTWESLALARMVEQLAWDEHIEPVAEDMVPIDIVVGRAEGCNCPDAIVAEGLCRC